MTRKKCSTADRMLQRPRAIAALGKIVRSLTRDVNLSEDFQQEASLHLWQELQRHPGHRWSWYLQGCHFHLMNEFRRGSSVDSLKRRCLCDQSDAESMDAQGEGNEPEDEG